MSTGITNLIEVCVKGRVDDDVAGASTDPRAKPRLDIGARKDDRDVGIFMPMPAN